jgi:hypothetical protein
MTRHTKIFLTTIAKFAIAIIILQGNVFSEVADARAIFLSEIPAYIGNVILGRPTDRSVTASVMMNSKSKICIAYGAGEDFDRKTEAVELNSGEPGQLLIDGLKTDTIYAYRIMDAESGKQVVPASGNYSFRTARLPGSSFVFAVEADSHLDGFCLPELYNIPAGVHSLPGNVRGVGVLGNNSVNQKTEYAPPHSKGPGAKNYT